MTEPTTDDNNLAIPRRFGGDAIVYTTSTLPEVDVVISELSGEHCKAKIWYKFALAYYSQELQQNDEGEESYVILKLHDTLTSYEVMKGYKETDKIKRKQHFLKALEHLDQGDKIFRYDENHLLQRAFYLLYEGKRLDHAEAQFKFVTNTNEMNVPALVGYACVLYNKKEYSKSLKLFKKVLKVCPRSPPYIRLGIGYCLFKLGYVMKARVAFERVLELDKNNSYALTALAVLEFGTNTLESTTAAGNKLIKAWKADNTNVFTSLEISDFLFLTTNYQKSEKYSKISLQLAESNYLRGRSHYFVGRSYHQKGQIEMAIHHYNVAVSLCGSEFLDPLFGLGQLHAKNRNYEKAIEYFEKVLISVPENTNTKKALVMMYVRSPGTELQQKVKRADFVKQCFFELLVGDNINDPLLITEHARFMEKTNVSVSLNEISAVVNIYKESNNNYCPIELLNNHGVYLYMNKMYAEADAIFSDCLIRNREEFSRNPTFAASLELTLTFNYARTKEELGYTNDAVGLYKVLLELKPDYYEGILRLGRIAEKGNDFEAAVNYYQKAITNFPQNIDALAMLGCLYMSKKNYFDAQKQFETIIKLPNEKTNAYAYLALGTIWLDQLYRPNRNKDKDNDYMARAFEMFSNVLKHHPKNVYAANGIGILLALIGNYEEARQCFAEVRENLFKNKSPWLNLAYVNGMLKNYLNAAQMYKAAIDKFGLGKDPEVLMPLGCMYWKREDYKNAMDCLTKAVNADGTNLYAMYNLAKVHVKVGLKTMESPNYSLGELDNAISYFNKAYDAFNGISNALNSNNDVKVKWKYLSISKISEEISNCSDYLIQANSSRPRVLGIEKAKEESRKKQQEMMLKLEEERLVQMKIQENLDLERQNRLRDLRNEFLNMNKDALRVPITEDKKKCNGKKGGKKKKKDSDELIVSEEELDEENEKKKRKKKSKKDSKRETSQSYDQEAENEEKSDESESFVLKNKSRPRKKAHISIDSDTSENEVEKNTKEGKLLTPPVSQVTVFGPGTDDSSNMSSN